MTPMVDARTAHTADLDAPTRRAARALLDDVFAPDMTDQEWEHALGGIHAFVWEGPPGKRCHDTLGPWGLESGARGSCLAP